MSRLVTKPTKWLRPSKLRSGIRPVWSESSLCAKWVAKGPSFLHADSVNSDQADLSLRWAHTHFVGFVTRWLKCLCCSISRLLFCYLLHKKSSIRCTECITQYKDYARGKWNIQIVHIWAASWQNQQMACHPAKTPISKGIRLVWSESSLSAWRNLGSLATHWAQRKDSDQTDLSLSWVQSHFVGFVMRQLIWAVKGEKGFLIVLYGKRSFSRTCTTTQKAVYLKSSYSSSILENLSPWFATW